MGVKTLQLFSNYKYNIINKFSNDPKIFFNFFLVPRNDLCVITERKASLTQC